MVRLIIGCGYLGLRAAKVWLERGDQVIALSRYPAALQQRAEALGIGGLRIMEGDVTEPASLSTFPVADTVLWAVGMDRTRYSDIRLVYVEGLNQVLQRLATRTQHLIYVSSTGVYGGDRASGLVHPVEPGEVPWVTEQTPAFPDRPGGQACREAEQLLQASRWNERTTVLRFAGIYGPDRIPLARAVADRQWSQLNPEGYLNLIQVLDGAQIISMIADRSPTGQIYLVSDGNPVERRKFYELMAEWIGTGPIDWDSSKSAPERAARRDSSNKRVSNQKLVQHFGYTFLFPDYRAGLRNLLAPNLIE